MSSNLVPLKTHHAEAMIHVKYVGTQTSFRWCGVEEECGGGERCELRCPRQLTMVQKTTRYPLKAEKPSGS
ncbi:hypothetical protein TNCV_4280171 [Trichonephila clavipes]|nr:hypothetical protein TNCV_4280171 [Trichonephila clavipes]